MRLFDLKLKNFRGYRELTTVFFDNLTALIGKNDAGKSTVLDALNIVLADGKVDAADICVHADHNDSMVIECGFTELPETLTLDSGSVTRLQDEYLVDAQGYLRLRWSWSVKKDNDSFSLGKQQVHVVTLAPTNMGLTDLHEKKNSDLKRLIKDEALEAACDLNNNASMRQALWSKACLAGTLTLAETTVELAAADGKSILKQIQDNLPLYVLFRADRPSTDQDAEVQDPMKIAVREALDALHDEIEVIKIRVREKSIEVANRTLDKLREFDPLLASSLTPSFAEPKLDTAFKLTLLGDDGIPVNKRGSGVRRLVLFSFFQAESERRQKSSGNRHIIYAVEEPETAQHPNFQRVVINTLRELSEQEHCQVLLTTHVPGLAGLLPVASLRLVERGGFHTTCISSGSDGVYQKIADTLGLIPDKRALLLLCVEGPTDMACLRTFCRIYRQQYPSLICIETDPRIATVLLGGSTLQSWTAQHLLQHTNIREFHLYDRDMLLDSGGYKYAKAVVTVLERKNGDTARLTKRREIENYLHPEAINRILTPKVGHQVKVSFTRDDDVESLVATAIPDQNGNPRKKLKHRDLKSWLNREVASSMTFDELKEVDSDQEVLGWFTEISRLVEDGYAL
jgi:putative ATP-dependent endonuclease of OLD family